nr:hypothetical protein Iba_chr07aCG16110 [Ipomoea batatas]
MGIEVQIRSLEQVCYNLVGKREAGTAVKVHGKKGFQSDIIWELWIGSLNASMESRISSCKNKEAWAWMQKEKDVERVNSLSLSGAAFQEALCIQLGRWMDLLSAILVLNQGAADTLRCVLFQSSNRGLSSGWQLAVELVLLAAASLEEECFVVLVPSQPYVRFLEGVALGNLGLCECWVGLLGRVDWPSKKIPGTNTRALVQILRLEGGDKRRLFLGGIVHLFEGRRNLDNEMKVVLAAAALAPGGSLMGSLGNMQRGEIDVKL